MTDWEVAVRTESNYIKKVRVDDCVSRVDAEAAALGMTGGKEIIYSTPKTYKDNDNKSSHSSNYKSEISFSGILTLIAIFIVISYWQYILIFSIIVGLLWFLFLRDE